MEKKGNVFTKGGNARGTALINRKRGQRKGHILIGQQPGIGYGKRSTCFLERTDLHRQWQRTKGTTDNHGKGKHECCCLRDPSRGILHCAQRTPLALDREGMTMGSQTVRRRTQPLYTREQVERVEQHLAVERILERLRVLHRLEWNRNLKQNSINWL